MPPRGTKKSAASGEAEQLAIPTAPGPALGPLTTPTLASVLGCLSEPRVLALHRVFGSDLRDRAGGKARHALGHSWQRGIDGDFAAFLSAQWLGLIEARLVQELPRQGLP